MLPVSRCFGISAFSDPGPDQTEIHRVEEWANHDLRLQPTQLPGFPLGVSLAVCLNGRPILPSPNRTCDFPAYGSPRQLSPQGMHRELRGKHFTESVDPSPGGEHRNSRPSEDDTAAGSAASGGERDDN